MTDFNKIAYPTNPPDSYTGPLLCAGRYPDGDSPTGGVILIGLGMDLTNGKLKRVRMEMSPEEAEDLLSVLPSIIKAAKSPIISSDFSED